MARRRRKGKPVSGWLVIDKPAGITSTQLVSKARWVFEAQKAGHAGTLDPLASGVLAIALGEATKTVPYVMDAQKAYRFTVRWGIATDTEDAEGKITARSDRRPQPGEIEAALPHFTGVIEQAPPAFSAIKVDGQRAYDLARRGEAPKMKARPVEIHSLCLLQADDPEYASFEMVCGKGTYVRSLARDLALALGTCGHVTALRRLWSGNFSLERAISLEKLEELRHNPGALSQLLPVSTGLADIPALAVTAEQVRLLQSGAAIAVHSDTAQEGLTWTAFEGRPVAIGFLAGKVFRPGRVFNTLS